MVERVVVGPWKTNCYIFSSSKKECVIIDPGGDETEIAARVDVLSMVPIGIALTHGHVDHTAALGKLQASYASRGYKLPVAVSAADKKYIGIGGLDIQREILDQLGLDGKDLFATAEELPRADVRLHDGDRVFDTDIVVLETPGHTSGSVCFYSEKEGILFSGDTLFFDGVGRSDLPGGSEKKLRESILNKIAVLPPETRVFPGHGPFTTVERERRGNPFLRQPQPVKPIAPLLARPVSEAPRVASVNGAPSRNAAAVPRRASKASPAARAPLVTGRPKKASSAHAGTSAPRAPAAKGSAGSRKTAAHRASKPPGLHKAGTGTPGPHTAERRNAARPASRRPRTPSVRTPRPSPRRARRRPRTRARGPEANPPRASAPPGAVPLQGTRRSSGHRQESRTRGISGFSALRRTCSRCTGGRRGSPPSARAGSAWNNARTDRTSCSRFSPGRTR